MSADRALTLDLRGKVAVVAGASAERGTGWAVAETLAAQGAHVFVAARSGEPLRRLADRIGGTAFPCDIGDAAQVAALAAAARSFNGRVDIAVNASGLPMLGTIADIGQEQLDDAIRVNYFGNVYFVQHMAEAIGSDGSIILFSSLTTTHPTAPHFAYACAKSATDCLVRYAALEYGPRRIRVNSILPGLIRSDLAAAALELPGFETACAREVPIGRIGETADFANAVLWLAGPAYVTGTHLQVNGGNHLTRFPYGDELSAGVDSFASQPIGDRISHP